MIRKFETHEVALAWAAELRPCLEAIGRCDPDLGRQLRRAAASVPLNLAEGAQRRGRDRMHLYRIAAGSAAEAEAALRLASAWGFVDSKEMDRVEALADRLRAMQYRLTHARE